jgi:hypothetical protein
MMRDRDIAFAMGFLGMWVLGATPPDAHVLHVVISVALVIAVDYIPKELRLCL